MLTKSYQQEELISFQRMQEGDEKAFDSFFLRYYTVLCSYARQFVSLEDAEEVVQDTMVWFYENKQELVIETTLIGYLFKSVKNRCISVIRKEKLRLAVLESMCTETQELFDSPDCYIVEELAAHIEEALASLPPSYKKAFEMHRFEHLTYQEIATLLNVSPKTVDYRIQQALKNLRVQLKDYLPLLLTFFNA